MNKAIWELCPGIINDGAYGHSMRDYCSSCAPFWGINPFCPIHRKVLSEKGYCKECRAHYDLITDKPYVRFLMNKMEAEGFKFPVFG